MSFGSDVPVLETKHLLSIPYHSDTHKRMLAQLPFEIVDDIVEYLGFEDLLSIARVSSAFLVPARRQLFRTTLLVPSLSMVYPESIESMLSSPHLLQYSSRLVVHCLDSIRQSSIHSLWSRLPTMYRLKILDVYLDDNDCLRVLSAPESLGLAREITLKLNCWLTPDLIISDDPLPVRALFLSVNASNHQIAARIIQKCSQSLRKLELDIPKTIDLPLPFLPHLDDFWIYTSYHRGHDPDLTWLFPFLDYHPTITRLSVESKFTLAVQPPPNLLPNLQFLSATPVIIERLIPGRAVNDIHARYFSRSACCFPDDTMLQSLRQPFVPVTTLKITTKSHLYNQDPADIVQALPKLRKFTLEGPCLQVCLFV